MTTTDIAVPVDVDEFASMGLEDIDASDLAMPRLTIDHNEAMLVDSLSGEKFNPINVILLGVVKQRILWDVDVDNDKMPLCKSLDSETGTPDLVNFPWKAAGAPADQYPEGTPLPCTACSLKEWGSHPQRDTPWCAEQFTLPLLMQIGEGWGPAILTLQRSAIKPAKAYLTSFVRARTPLFTVRTEISLKPNKKGNVNYAVPYFSKGDPTDQAEWPAYATQYRLIREFIQTPRQRDDDSESSAPAAAAATSTPAAGAPANPSAAPAAASAAIPDEEEIPF